MGAQTLLTAGLVIAFVLLLILAVTVHGYSEKLRALQSKMKTGEAPVRKASEPAQPIPPFLPEAPALTVEEGIPGEVVAAISAAVACMLPGTAVTSVRRAARPARSVWGMAGLLESTKPF